MLFYQGFYPTKLDRTKAEISRECYRTKPELCGKFVTIYVYVRRLTRLVAVKIEAVRARSKNGRQSGIVSNCSLHRTAVDYASKTPTLGAYGREILRWARAMSRLRWPGMRVRAETPGPPAWKGA